MNATLDSRVLASPAVHDRYCPHVSHPRLHALFLSTLSICRGCVRVAWTSEGEDELEVIL